PAPPDVALSQIKKAPSAAVTMPIPNPVTRALGDGIAGCTDPRLGEAGAAGGFAVNDSRVAPDEARVRPRRRFAIATPSVRARGRSGGTSASPPAARTTAAQATATVPS